MDFAGSSSEQAAWVYSSTVSLDADLQNAVRFSTSLKGKRILCVGPFIYHLNKRTETSEYWECSRRKSSGCASKLVVGRNTNPTNILKESGEHNHCADFGAVEAKQSIAK